MTASTIPFNRPAIVGNEFEYLRQAIENGHTASSGPFTRRVAELLRAHHEAPEALLTTSCSSALEMAALLLDPEPGDTVIVPSFTFVTSALAFVRAGFRLVFADIEPTTLGIDPEHVAGLIDDRTRAVVAVHYAGVACDLDGLQAVLADHPGIDLIEDNAQGISGAHKGRPLGTFGRFSALSFHETKNVICGEGGALIVNDPTDVDRAHVVLDKGTDRRRFMLGNIDKYSWRDIGSSFGLSDLNAAFLLAQLEHLDAIAARRRRIYEGYLDRLAPHADHLGFTLPTRHHPDEAGYHLFHVLVRSSEQRDRALASLKDEGIHATFHYVPLHDSEGGQKFAARTVECPRTSDVSSRLIRLPFFNDLQEEEIDRVVDALVRVLD